ncbi:universal stress protein [Cryptosporangium arvum]|uniref:universal stress protein n=1 Tax=Cryptosporangium arvum TaxID=80871 RepID=UPI001B80A23B
MVAGRCAHPGGDDAARPAHEHRAPVRTPALHAEADDADLLVIGSRRLDPVTGLIVGPVGVEPAAASAPCPLVVVNDGPVEAGKVIRATWRSSAPRPAARMHYAPPSGENALRPAQRRECTTPRPAARMHYAPPSGENALRPAQRRECTTPRPIPGDLTGRAARLAPGAAAGNVRLGFAEVGLDRRHRRIPGRPRRGPGSSGG